MPSPWIADYRAYHVYTAWRKSPYRRSAGEYGIMGHFREWVAFTCGRFFNVLACWSEFDLQACCTRLGIEMQSPPAWLSDSISEDEALYRSLS